MVDLARRLPKQPSPANEGELVARARGGEREAFESLYRRHVGRIFALCLRMSGTIEAAEDLTQDAFVRAWRKLGSFGGRSAFGTWLHALAVRVVLSERRRRTTGQTLVGLEEEPVAAPPTGEPLDLEGALDLLPRGARQAFVLHDIEGYTHEEIARRCGIATGTVKAQLHRARRLLREALER